MVDLATREVSWLKPTIDVSLTGINGLYRFGNELIAVQNGSNPMRLMRMHHSPIVGHQSLVSVTLRITTLSGIVSVPSILSLKPRTT